MPRSILIGLATSGCLLAGAAMAQEVSTDELRRSGQDLPSAQTSATRTEDALSTSSVPADRLAPTPSANVASSTTITDSTGAIVTRELVASAPVPDTPENRARYGQPLSNAGRMTAPRGN
jgi:hypothetical protein